MPADEDPAPAAPLGPAEAGFTADCRAVLPVRTSALMIRWGVTTVLCAAACGVSGDPGPQSGLDGARPRIEDDPAFVPAAPAVATIRQGASLVGDVVVVPGDARTVSSSGPGRFGITAENRRAVIDAVLSVLPDRYDAVLVGTSFEDEAVENAAFELLCNDVRGIGLSVFDARPDFGLSPDGRLCAYATVGDVAGYGPLDQLGAVRGRFHALASALLASRWTMYLRFQAATGPSTALLGEGDFGWSALAQSSGSLARGVLLEVVTPPDADGVGAYRVAGRNLGFAPLDLYAMGRIPPEQVPVLFYLANATVDGEAVTRTDRLEVGTEIRGQPVLVNVQQVIDAMGRRQPSARAQDPFHRVAFAFVTAPGESRAAYQAKLDAFEQARASLPASWRAWGGGSLCTDIATPCPEPQLRLLPPVIEDDGDGIVSPGERVRVLPVLRNVGIGTAEGVQVRVSSLDPAATVEGEARVAPPVPEGESVQLAEGFELTVSATVACGSGVALRAEITTREGPVFTDDFVVAVGTRRLRFDPLEEAPDWRVDPDGNDNATRGAFALGPPEEVSAAGVLTQPGEDHTPDGELAFFTGPRAGSFFSTHNLTGGRTTLESPVFSLGDAQDPVLVFRAWRSVWDFTQDPPRPERHSPLRVSVSSDGGETYAPLGEFSGQTESWARVSFRLRDAIEPTDRVRFRFVAEEQQPANVEIGIDDIELLDFAATCTGTTEPEPEPEVPDTGEGGGCRTGPGTVASALAVLLLFWRRRR